VPGSTVLIDFLALLRFFFFSFLLHDPEFLTNICFFILQQQYIKVSRGLLTASSIVTPIKDREATEIVTHVLIKNASFDTVSKLTLTWKVDLKA
jgi:hypothetical protein